MTPQGGSATITNDTYQNGLLQYETHGSGTLLATFTYDGQGVPVSVRVGSDPNASPIYYYVYNGHGDVDALVDGTGTVVASYSYDDWGAITSSSESFAGGNGWTNPYRYDGHDRVRYDPNPMPPTALLLQLACFRRGPVIGRGPIVRQAPPTVPHGLPRVKADPCGARLRSWRLCGAALTAGGARVAGWGRAWRSSPRRSGGPHCCSSQTTGSRAIGDFGDTNPGDQGRTAANGTRREVRLFLLSAQRRTGTNNKGRT